MDPYKKLQEALKGVSVVRQPQRTIYTFGVTRAPYLLAGIVMDAVDKVEIRRGRVMADRPRIVTPTQFTQTFFEGFGGVEQEHAEALFRRYGRALEYRYRNEMDEVQVVGGPIEAIVERLRKEADSSGQPGAAIIRCEDSALWGLGLMKYILEVTVRSFGGNITELEERGFFSGEGKS